MTGMTWDYKLLLVSNWLEDINWHKENTELMQTYKFRNQIKMQMLETLNYLTHKYSNYSTQFIQELEVHLQKTGEYELYMELLRAITERGRGVMKGEMIDRDDVYQYARTMSYSQFSYMFGWGIDGADWTSKGHGSEFVKELFEVINED